MHRIVAIGMLALTLCGCREDTAEFKAARSPTSSVQDMRDFKYKPTPGYVPPPEVAAAAPAYAPRIRIDRIDVVTDSLAYGDARGVYIITDTQSGEQYVGVSGIGISELGSHRSGKTTVGDER